MFKFVTGTVIVIVLLFSLPVLFFFSGIGSKGFFRNIESVSDAVSLRVSVLHRKKQKVGHHRIGDLLFKTSTVSL